jgi:hypothetical protein
MTNYLPHEIELWEIERLTGPRRALFGKGTPRGLRGRFRGLFSVAECFRRLPTATASLVCKFGHRMAPQPIVQRVLIAALK